MRAIILSAGLGERLRPLTLQRAKPAIEFLNIPMLAFPCFWFESVGVDHVVFNTHHLAETIRHAAMHVVRPEWQMYFMHEDAILGSGGGIWNARFHLQGEKTFAVANADGVVTFAESESLARMLGLHEHNDALATLLVCPVPGVGRDFPGAWIDKKGEIVNFGKTPKKENLECLHYASYLYLSQRIWNYLPEGPSNLIYDALELAIAQGEKVCAYRVDNMRWFETGNSADYLASTRKCLSLLAEGHAFADPLRKMLQRFAPNFTQRSDFKKNLLIDDSAEIGKAQLSGFNVIGAGCTATGDFKDCVLLPGADAQGPQQSAVLI